MKIYTVIFVVVLLFLSVSVQAGLVITISEEVQGVNMQSEQTMFIDKDMLRMEMSGEEENQTVIFRGDKNVFWVIDSEKKSYFEMTQEDIANLKSQMESMQKMMMEQMKNMPEEQRKMMEDMMPGNMSTEKKAKPVYTKKSGGVKVGNWTTTHYEGTTEGKKSDDLWTVDWSETGFKRSDFAVMTKMADFFSALSQEATDFMNVGSEEWEKEMGISGMPVRWKDYLEGGSTSEGSIKEISQKNLDASLFDLPAGFKKDQSPMKNMGKGMNPDMEE
jgi:hypothetical protein